LFPWWREAESRVFFCCKDKSVKIKTNLLMAQEIFFGRFGKTKMIRFVSFFLQGETTEGCVMIV
jgi:hypothetical protein